MLNANLIDQLNRAIEAKTTACNIGDIVTAEPLINTCQERDRTIIGLADYAADPDERNSFIDLSRAKDVVYWKIDHPHQVKIIGLWWDDEDTIKLFRAIVLPP